jgi:hypothetical protein
MNTYLPLNYPTSTTPANHPAFNFARLQSFIHSVFSLFAAQDDPAALRYMLTKNGETVD